MGSNNFNKHTIVINNFIIKIGSQLKDSLCRVLGDNVQYQWSENNNEIVIPDASIICNMRDRKNVSFTGIPRFVMEVLSEGTKQDDYTRKMEIYKKVGISEYWIVDWRERKVEIYLFDGNEDGTIREYLYKTVTEDNKEELNIVMFPHLHISFDELFNM